MGGEGVVRGELLRRYALLAQVEEPIPPMPTTWTEVQRYSNSSLSTTYTATKSAWYKLHMIGPGGRGGSGGSADRTHNYSGGGGGGGGGGGYCIHAVYLKSGQTIRLYINSAGTYINCGETKMPKTYPGKDGGRGGSATSTSPGGGGSSGNGGAAENGNIITKSGIAGYTGNTGRQLYYTNEHVNGGNGGRSGAYNFEGSDRFNTFGFGGIGGHSGELGDGGTTVPPESGTSGGNGAIIIEIGG